MKEFLQAPPSACKFADFCGHFSKMNANEVIANRAIELPGGKKGDYRIVRPNDEVNMAQSTNDVIPEVVNQVAFLVMGHDLTISAVTEARHI